MNKEQIEKAAKDRAEILKFRLEEDARFYEECFIEGAEWALSPTKMDKKEQIIYKAISVEDRMLRR